MTGYSQPLLLVSYRAVTRMRVLTRDSGFPLRLTPPTVAPGQTPGALRFVSLALHIPSHKGEGRRRHVSARNASESNLHPETLFL